MKKCFVFGCREEPLWKCCCLKEKVYCCASHQKEHIEIPGTHNLQALIVHLSNGKAPKTLNIVDQLNSIYDLVKLNLLKSTASIILEITKNSDANLSLINQSKAQLIKPSAKVCSKKVFKDKIQEDLSHLSQTPTPSFENIPTLIKSFEIQTTELISEAKKCQILENSKKAKPLQVAFNLVPFEEAKKYLSQTTKSVLAKLGPYKFDPQPILNVSKKGPIKLENKSIYIGEWSLNNQRHGKGTNYWEDGTIYEGYWENDKANGEGRCISYNGNVYIGNWKDCKANGKGIYITFDGIKYEGDWVNDKHHGFGIETWVDVIKYQGHYENGLKSGFGKCNWEDGTVYFGNFSNNDLQGYGKYEWNDGRKFEGQFKNGKKNGKGILTWNDGRRYEGEYVDDARHGFGIEIFLNGVKYEGNWLDDKKHGKGKYVTAEIEKVGEWHHGEIIRWL